MNTNIERDTRKELDARIERYLLERGVNPRKILDLRYMLARVSLLWNVRLELDEDVSGGRLRVLAEPNRDLSKHLKEKFESLRIPQLNDRQQKERGLARVVEFYEMLEGEIIVNEDTNATGLFETFSLDRYTKKRKPVHYNLNAWTNLRRSAGSMYREDYLLKVSISI